MKIVINRDYGGFGLSNRAVQWLAAQGVKTERVFDIERNNPLLVSVVEALGKEASGKYASLAVIEIPDNVEWEIEEYDGKDWISEKHRRWY